MSVLPVGLHDEEGSDPYSSLQWTTFMPWAVQAAAVFLSVCEHRVSTTEQHMSRGTILKVFRNPGNSKRIPGPRTNTEKKTWPTFITAIIYLGYSNSELPTYDLILNWFWTVYTGITIRVTVSLCSFSRYRRQWNWNIKVLKFAWKMPYTKILK